MKFYRKLIINNKIIILFLYIFSEILCCQIKAFQIEYNTYNRNNYKQKSTSYNTIISVDKNDRESSSYEIEYYVNFINNDKQNINSYKKNILDLNNYIPDQLKTNICKIIDQDLLNINQEHSETDISFITLENALKSAVLNNLIIKIQYAKSLETKQDYLDEKSKYDVLLSYKIKNSEKQSGPGYYVDDKLKLYLQNLSIKKKTSTGSIFELIADLQNEKEIYTDYNTYLQEVTTGLTLRLTQPLLKGYGEKANLNSLKILENQIKKADKDFQAALEDMVFNVLTNYLKLLAYYKDISIKKESQQKASEVLQLVSKKLNIGRAVQSDLVQAQTSLSLSKESVIYAKNYYKKALLQLFKIINPSYLYNSRSLSIYPATDLYVDHIDSKNYNIDHEIKIAFNNRKDLALYEIELKNNQLSEQLYKNLLLPEVNIISGLGFRSMDSNFKDSLHNLDNRPFWDIGLNFEYPLSNRGSKAQYNKIKLNKSRTMLMIKEIKNQIAFEVRNAIVEVSSAYDIYNNTKQTRKLAKSQYEREMIRFNNGLSTIFVINRLRLEKAVAESNLIQNYIDYIISLIKLEKIKGTLLKAKFYLYVKN